MLIFIVFSLIWLAVNTYLKKTTFLGNNLFLKTLTIISSVIFLIYLGNIYFNKEDISDKTFTLERSGLTLILKPKIIIAADIKALFNICNPPPNYRDYHATILKERLFVLIHDQLRYSSSYSNSIEEFKVSVNNKNFIEAKLNKTKEHGICVKSLKVNAYNKAIKKDV